MTIPTPAPSIDKVDRDIRDSIIRLGTERASVEGLDREIEILSLLEVQIRENIIFLKQKKIVALATEFKKSKEDLEKLKVKITSLMNDREKHRKNSNAIEKFLLESKELLEKLKQKNAKKVILVDFGSSDG